MKHSLIDCRITSTTVCLLKFPRLIIMSLRVRSTSPSPLAAAMDLSETRAQLAWPDHVCSMCRALIAVTATQTPNTNCADGPRIDRAASAAGVVQDKSKKTITVTVCENNPGALEPECNFCRAAIAQNSQLSHFKYENAHTANEVTYC